MRKCSALVWEAWERVPSPCAIACRFEVCTNSGFEPKKSLFLSEMHLQNEPKRTQGDPRMERRAHGGEMQNEANLISICGRRMVRETIPTSRVALRLLRPGGSGEVSV
jgi:hypothetical protein